MSRSLTKEHEADEARDRERYGGPITAAMLHTMLLSVQRDTFKLINPRDQFDLTQAARIVNSWLTPVDRRGQ